MQEGDSKGEARHIENSNQRFTCTEKRWWVDEQAWQ